MPEFHQRVSSSYEHALAVAFHRIDNRGLYIDESMLGEVREFMRIEVDDALGIIGKHWNCDVWRGADKSRIGINLNAPKQVIPHLESLGFKVPKKRGTENKTVDELALIRLYADSGDPALKQILRIREIDAVGKFVNANLCKSIYYCSYNVAGTNTGRRGSVQHILGLGNNAQNIPKYNSLGKKFRRCIKPRPGKIFFNVDQVQAEDWPVTALSYNLKALEDMRHGVDRHTKLASFIFSKPEAQIAKYPDRFLGKKFRHANNYEMGANTASETLAKEGFAFSPAACQVMIDRVNQFDPSIRNVFHEYIRTELEKTHCLTTPLGRERQFLGLRPKDKNVVAFKEAFAFIPQSLVGDNNGISLLIIEYYTEDIVNECHDSITREIDDDEKSLIAALKLAQRAYDREIKFPNGIIVKIPIEAELGYNFSEYDEKENPIGKLALKHMTEDCLIATWHKLKENKRNLDNAAQTNSTVVGSVSGIHSGVGVTAQL